MQRIVLLTICGVFPALLAAGCGADTEGHIGVSGNVRTNDGKPLRVGRILFTPEKDNAGPAAGGPIKNGRYKILATQGPTAGMYTVIVTTGALPQKSRMIGSDPSTPKPPPQENHKYHFKNKEIVAGDGECELNFDLPPSSKPST